MERYVREFLEQEAAVTGARSKAAKKQKRQRVNRRFASWLVAKAERIEANGDPAAAENFRRFWGRFHDFRKVFPPGRTDRGA